jgi:hypothetical protein
VKAGNHTGGVATVLTFDSHKALTFGHLQRVNKWIENVKGYYVNFAS